MFNDESNTAFRNMCNTIRERVGILCVDDSWSYNIPKLIRAVVGAANRVGAAADANRDYWEARAKREGQ